MNLSEIKIKLEGGSIFLHPTDTLPGIGCLSHHKDSVLKISNIKKVTKNRQGFIGLVGSFEQAYSEFSTLHDRSVKLLEKFWPGPLTFVHESKNQSTTALRFPLIKSIGLEWFRELLAWAPSPLISTSVNVSGKEHAKNWQEATDFCKSEDIQNIIIPNMTYPLNEQDNKKRHPSTIIKGTVDGRLILLRAGDPEFLNKIMAFDSNIEVTP